MNMGSVVFVKLFLCGSFLILTTCGPKPPAQMVKAERIQAITASSQSPAFPPTLLLDGVPHAENAWHSAVGSLLPQWIQLQFRQPLRVRQFGLQAQFNSPGNPTDNLRRAPRKLEVWGSDDREFKTYQNLGSFECAYAAPGEWCERSISATGKAHLYFRFVIVENGGDTAFVTIQEMNLFAED